MSSSLADVERVVITGFGVRSPATVDEALALLASGESRIAMQEVSQSGGTVHAIGASAEAAPPTCYLPQRKWLKYMGPQTQLALWAAGNALTDAGLREDRCSDIRHSMALVLATGPIAFDLDDIVPALAAVGKPDGTLDWGAVGDAGLRACSPMMPFHTLLNMPVGLVSMCFDIRGHNAIFYPDAAQSLFALNMATRGIRHGRFRTALVGGTAQLMSLMPLATHKRLGYLAAAPECARPWSPNHLGWAPGNGAAMVVLEAESHARARGARIYAVLDVTSTEQNTPDVPSGSDLIVVSGTRSYREDEHVVRCVRGHQCLSFDGIIGYLGPAALPWSLAAGCRLLEKPVLLEGGHWKQRGRISVVSATAGKGEPRWARLQLEAVS